MRYTVRIEGLKELDRALGELPKSTAAATLRRVLLKTAKPMAEDMRSRAPDDPNTKGDDLKSSIAASTKLSPKQKKLHKRATKNDKAFAEMFVGAGPLPQAHMQEFGTTHHGPQPFARPTWDAWRPKLLDTFGADLAAEIEKSVERLARKAARLAAKK